jgi:hypothetical protein
MPYRDISARSLPRILGWPTRRSDSPNRELLHHTLVRVVWANRNDGLRGWRHDISQLVLPPFLTTELLRAEANARGMQGYAVGR